MQCALDSDHDEEMESDQSEENSDSDVIKMDFGTKQAKATH